MHCALPASGQSQSPLKYSNTKSHYRGCFAITILQNTIKQCCVCMVIKPKLYIAQPDQACTSAGICLTAIHSKGCLVNLLEIPNFILWTENADMAALKKCAAF